MNTLISVIVPVYQAENTIERCIKSIVSHTAEIEIICVNDGSSDSSSLILDRVASEDSRLRVIHQPNAGAGAARNRGIEEAVGQYIMFCDADDVYLPDTIDIVVEDIAKFGFDYLVFHRKTVLLDGGTNYWGGKGETVSELKCSWSEYLNEYMIQRGHGGVVVNKVFRKDIINNNNVAFEKFRFGEDWWFNLTYLVHCNKFVEDYRAYYQQFQSEGSICMSAYSNYYDKNIEWMETFISRYPMNSKEIQPFLYKYYFITAFVAINRIIKGVDAKSHIEKRRAIKGLFLREDIKDHLTVALRICNLSSQERRNCLDITNNNLLRFTLRNHILPTVKMFMKKIIFKR